MSAVSARVRALVCALLGLAAGSAPAALPGPGAPARTEYVMGVFPHLPPRDLEEVFGPMARDLGAALGRPVVFASSTTYERFAENLDTQAYDLVFVQPFEYVRIADRHGYRPLATRTEKLAAIVVVNADSPLGGLADLKGKRVALPPESAAVSHLLIGHLRSHGLVPGKDVALSYHRSHVSCLQKVVIGEVDACGTAAPALRRFQSKMDVALKVIGQSREIPHSLFALHPRVPEQDRERIRQRILGWGENADGRRMLARGELTPFVSARDADYNVVRELAK